MCAIGAAEGGPICSSRAVLMDCMTHAVQPIKETAMVRVFIDRKQVWRLACNRLASVHLLCCGRMWSGQQTQVNDGSHWVTEKDRVTVPSRLKHHVELIPIPEQGRHHAENIIPRNPEKQKRDKPTPAGL